MKYGGLILLSFIFLSIFIVSFVIAAEDDEIKGQVSCVEECNDFWMSATPMCPGEQKVSGTYPDCECGWECSEEDFEDDSNYMCEDMNEIDCEAAKDCESILGSSFCEGDACTMDMVWKGCGYKGDELFEDYKDIKFEKDAGTTPGSNFYFIDKFFDRFGDELEVKEERIAEIKAMVESGDLEFAKIALKEYMELAEEIEHEIEPERKEDALKSAAAIRSAMKDIRDKLPPGERGEFVSSIMEKEHSIATAAEISFKIKDLCEALSEVDPLEYSRVCKTDDNAPEWQKKLDKDLSVEQEKIAREFVDTMKQCFKTSGQDCSCEEIPFYDFSIACSKAAPLAVACDIEGDEVACDELDNLEMPELPEWLEPIWEDLESGMMEAQYDMHMPPECVEAGVTSPKDCGKVMIKEHAPLECRAALLEADVQSEREGRKICDKIMFELHSPQECIDEGITSPRECSKLMDSFRHEGPGEHGFGMDCGRIEDAMGRLDCYDNKGNKFEDHYGPRDGEGHEGEITWQCKEHRIHWPPDCEKFMREELPQIERQQMEEGDLRRSNEEDWRVKERKCAASCDLENGWWDFRDGECICKTDDRSSDDTKPGEVLDGFGGGEIFCGLSYLPCQGGTRTPTPCGTDEYIQSNTMTCSETHPPYRELRKTNLLYCCKRSEGETEPEEPEPEE